jgi:EpsI family protein
MIALAAVVYLWLLQSGRADRNTHTTRLAMELDQLPMRLNGWSGRDVPLSEDMVKLAGVTTCLNRQYVAADGQRVDVYIAYYAHVMDRVPHGPTVCLPYHGWEKKEEQVITLPTEAPGFGSLKVEKLLYERDFSQVAFLYWYAANGKQMIGRRRMYAESAWRRFLGLFGPGGGYLVQVSVSAPIADSRERAFDSVERFFRQNFDTIAKHFPQTDGRREAVQYAAK